MHFVDELYRETVTSYLHESETDNIIRAMPVEVLNTPLERDPLRCSFFALDGDSISAIAVVSRSRSRAIEFAVQDVFKHKASLPWLYYYVKQPGLAEILNAVLENALWEIVGFVSFGEETDYAEDDKTFDEMGDFLEYTITLEVDFIPAGSDTAQRGIFRECDTQKLEEARVLDFWIDQGGRIGACGYDPMMVTLFQILDQNVEQGGLMYLVQFMRLSREEAEWMKDDAVQDSCPELAEAWEDKE
ncbi:NPS5 [Fusarium pseudoanthophilum]|uniref:NPS5 n=1 Tax=Fusarium pseudoanthophilum TaxID=48495 RepID=A0A8H5UQD1_9HYPO|nr:NPS5 [Fusarium pseudoanthophilum]